ncbi:hypothetical protein FISHEDRAFT_74357 [Fistulina hepatica ATCC 64428]|uniref:Uncharacterized protein n=1 Tax=Fistulina hepatica ATCC 64428 TaxID=1128425 RepID=A0A0D7A9K2_9AGAR|nr:hypothetical protein FISHEDRAFT_74357 [Fistulina hepatica ATCC 64428]
MPHRIFDLPELVDEFVLHLCRDRRSLKSCSLASKIFLEPCQRSLFHSIVLRPQVATRAIDPAVRFVRFIALVESSPHIIPYVRTLHLCDEAPSVLFGNAMRHCMRGFWQTMFMNPLFVRVLATVVHVQHTYFSSGVALDWKRIPTNAREALRTFFRLPSISFVSLRGIIFNVPADLFEGCPYLTYLELDGVAFDEECNECIAAACSDDVEPSLRRLDLGMYHRGGSGLPVLALTSLLDRWCRTTSYLNPVLVTHLSVRWHDAQGDSLYSLNRLIHAAPLLEDLAVQEFSAGLEIDLSPCRYLKYLRGLLVNFFTSSEQHFDVFRIIHTLSTLPKDNNLRVLEIFESGGEDALVWDRPPLFLSRGLAKLDNVLSSTTLLPAFEALRVGEPHLVAPSDKRVDDLLRVHMPRLHAKGGLHLYSVTAERSRVAAALGVNVNDDSFYAY